MILTRDFTPSSNPVFFKYAVTCHMQLQPLIFNMFFLLYTMFKVKIYSANRLKSPQKYCQGTKLYFFVGKSKHVLLNFRVVSNWFLVGSFLRKPLSLTLKIGKKNNQRLKKTGKCISENHKCQNFLEKG